MNLSIVISTTNCYEYLEKCLRSIEETITGIEYEIICADNNSSDGTVAKVRQHFPKVHMIALDDNTGFAFSTNKGLEVAQGKHVLVLNPDTVLLGDAVKKSMDFLDENPEAGVVAVKLLNEDGSLQPSLTSFPTLWNYFLESTFLYLLFGKSKIINAYFPEDFGYDEVKEIDVVKGCYMLIRKEILDKVGHFDTRFWMYTEEVDLCYRIRLDGWKIYYIPDAQIIHFGGRSTLPQHARMFVEMHKTKLFYHLKYFGKTKAFVAFFLLFIGIIPRLAIWFIADILYKIGLIKGHRDLKIKLRNYAAAARWYLTRGFGYLVKQKV